MFDAKTQKRVDDTLAKQLTPRERKFINALADGLTLISAWRGIGEELYSGWKADAGAMERRLSKRRAAIERPHVERMKAVERAERTRLKAIEWARHREQTAQLRAKLSIGLMVIVHADVSAVVSDDGRLSIAALKASGLGQAIRSIRVHGDGRLRSVRLHDKTSAARLLEQLA